MATKTQDTLPSFEGRRPDTLQLNITGGVEFDADIAEAHHLDEYVYLVVGVEISKVAHSTDKEGALSRVETGKVDRLAVFTDAGEAGDLITRLHREARQRHGVEELPLK